MKKNGRIWIGFLLFISSILVPLSGVVSAATRNVPGDFSTIQAAVNAANPGDTVRVAPGTYFENLTVDKTIVLTSHIIDSGDTSFIDTTIIDGGGIPNDVIDVPRGAGPGTTIQGFTIRNGNNGVDILGQLQFLNNRVTNTNDAVDYAASGGGLVKDCLIDNNNDDAVDVDGNGAIIVENSILDNNNDDGVEIRLTDRLADSSEVIIRNSVISNNREDGIQIIQPAGLASSRVVRIENNLILDNDDAGIGLSITTVEDFGGADVVERIHVNNNTLVGNNHGITGGDNLIALNNLLVNTTNIALKNVDGSSIAAFNLFFGNGQDFSSSNVDSASSVFADPLLDGNNEITSISPAVDAGTAFFEHNSEVVLNLPGSAFNGAAPDMGHIETASTSPTNQAPDVNAGPNQSVVLPNTVTLDATVTDDGLPSPPNLTFNWTQEGGPSATIFTPNAEDTEISFSTAGTYVFRLTADDSALTGFDEVTVNVSSGGGSPNTLSIPISFGTDDVEEKPDGTVITGSSDLDMVASGGNQTIGMRFNEVGIPLGATITSASIQFTAANTRSTATSLILQGEAVGNSAPFVKGSGSDVSTRSRTTASVPWSPAAWTAGERGAAQLTSDLTPIIQEIVSGAGWSNNNSLAIIITGTGKREADTFEANSANVAVLQVAFDGAGGGNQPPTVSITEPANGSTVSEGNSVTFMGTATDVEDGSLTSSLSWDSSLDGSIGTGGSFSTAGLSLGTHTITASVTDGDGAPGSAAIAVTVQAAGGGTTLSIPISLGTDDVEEKPDGTVITGSSDLDMVASGGDQTIGLRFNGVGIPQGATITSAAIQFTAANTRATATSLTLAGEAVDNAAPFVKGSGGDVSARPPTTNTVPWSPAPWTAGDSGSDQLTPDLTAIIQEIVSRAGWSSNNSLGIIITGTGKREADSFEANPANPATLQVEFQ